MDGCNDHTFDLSLQRNFRSRRGPPCSSSASTRINAFNTVVYSGRVTTVQFNSPTDQTVRNSQYLADGSLNPAGLTAEDCRIRRGDAARRRCGDPVLRADSAF